MSIFLRFPPLWNAQINWSCRGILKRFTLIPHATFLLLYMPFSENSWCVMYINRVQRYKRHIQAWRKKKGDEPKQIAREQQKDSKEIEGRTWFSLNDLAYVHYYVTHISLFRIHLETFQTCTESLQRHANPRGNRLPANLPRGCVVILWSSPSESILAPGDTGGIEVMLPRQVSTQQVTCPSLMVQGSTV